ncbi:MAG: hypothetical protein V3V18_13985 [Methylococcales bacterium]
MDKPIADSKERAELLTDIMRGDITLQVPHPDFPDVMVLQQPDINARLKAVDLLARMHGDYIVRAEVTLSVDYAAELTRLKQLADGLVIDGEYDVEDEDEELSFF